MNVLILTPDRVGSTLLQRLITIYMNMHEFDQPVINLHELTNGLIKYLNSRFNREVLGKPNDANSWGYYQTLPEIVELLSSADHYKTSRLARYHIVNRQDSIKDQLQFYQYLNDNFFIISAQRENLFEHALSWCIHSYSKVLNVCSVREKVIAFYDIYRNRIVVEPENLVRYLDQYSEYLRWVNDHFHVNSYFKYERDLPNIENYILNLSIFDQTPKLTWENNFGVSWNDWNKCHYLLSDLSGLSNQVNPLQLEHKTTEYQLTVSNSKWTSINHNPADQQFLTNIKENYKNVSTAINELVKDKVLVNSVPIKLQTMLEKKLLIKNFDQCVEVYNDWVSKNNLGQPYEEQHSAEVMQRELLSWHQTDQLTN